MAGVFTEDYKKTIGVDFLEKALYVAALGEDVRMFCWDTAGQEEFDSITKTYYRGAGAAVIAFSTTDRASFDAVPGWRRKVAAECGDIAMVLVQNKVDLLDRAAVSSEEAEEMARRLGLKFYRSCVKEGLNVTEVFSDLAELHDHKMAAGQIAPGSAAQALAPPGAPAAAAASGAGAAAAAGGGEEAEAGAASAGGGGGAAGAGPSWGGGGGAGSGWGSGRGGAGALPATVELEPSRRRGKKSLGQRVSKAASKASRCVS
ncbi:MAG: small rab-related GTPase [Monoraphidium minutum]|nr:MAG: small rab-related GTPase [Monoraphidium minutum]